MTITSLWLLAFVCRASVAPASIIGRPLLVTTRLLSILTVVKTSDNPKLNPHSIDHLPILMRASHLFEELGSILMFRKQI